MENIAFWVEVIPVLILAVATIELMILSHLGKKLIDILAIVSRLDRQVRLREPFIT